MSDRQRLIDRVRKLLEYNADNATEAEVSNAMAAAQRIIEEHELDADELREHAAPGTSAAPVERDRKSSPLGGKLSQWESMLGWAVATAVPTVSHYVHTRIEQRFGGPKRVTSVVWFGPQDATAAAELLFNDTRLVIATMAQGLYGGCYRGEGRSYAEGFAMALLGRARAERRTHDAQRAELAAAAPTAIVPVTLAALATRAAADNKAWLRTQGVKLSSRGGGGGGGAHHGDAYGRGKADGARAGFSAGGGRRSLPAS